MLFLLSNHTLETAAFGVLRASLPFRSRGTILPANYLDLLSLGGMYKDKAVKYTQGTPRTTGSLKWGGKQLCPSGCTCDAPETQLCIL